VVAVVASIVINVKNNVDVGCWSGWRSKGKKIRVNTASTGTGTCKNKMMTAFDLGHFTTFYILKDMITDRAFFGRKACLSNSNGIYVGI
jgi:hypothetical protein